MKDQKLHLQIPETCSQSWPEMESTNQGGYCKSCQKEVVDFTQMSDRELLDYFAIHHHRKTCGRLRPDQLQREFSYSYTQQPLIWWKKWVAVAVGLFAGAQVTLAQSPTPTEKERTTGDIAGKITDNSGEGIIGAYLIVYKNGHNEMAVTTDLDGNFKLRLAENANPENYSVEISYAGYESKFMPMVTFMDKNVHEVLDLEEHYMLGDLVIVRRQLKHRVKSFFARFERKEKKRRLRKVISAMASIFKTREKTERSDGAEAVKIEKEETREAMIYPTQEIVNVYPNPFLEQIILELDWPRSEYAFVRLLSSDAKPVFERRHLMQAGKQSFVLNIQESLAAGNYILVLENGGGEVFSEILVKASR